MAQPVGALMSRFPRMGRLRWIGVRPGHAEAVRVLARARLLAGRGVEGDRYADRRREGGARQVTLIQAEHLDAVARLMGRRELDPALLRRNLVVEGINLQALRFARFRLGAALLEGAGDCHPCSRMEEALGPGGYNAMRGHGGIVARVVEGGEIAIGDAVVYVAPRMPPTGPPEDLP